MATIKQQQRKGIQSRYQKTGEDTADWEDLSVRSSELEMCELVKRL
jgi:hypothetical protein